MSGGLTKRETEVMVLVVQGKRTSDIAEILGIAHTTARNYRQLVMTKTGCGNAAQLVQWALFHSGYSPNQLMQWKYPNELTLTEKRNKDD